VNLHQIIQRKHPGLFSAVGASLFLGLGGLAIEGFAATALSPTVISAEAVADGTVDTASSINPGAQGAGRIGAEVYIGLSPNNAIAEASGSPAEPNFALSAQANGVSRSSADYSFNYSFTNLAATAQQYTLSGTIFAGAVDFLSRSYNPASQESGSGGFGWYLSFNGNNVATTKGVFSQLPDGSTGAFLSQTGVSLTNYVQGTTGISWSDTAYSAELGQLAPGASGTFSIYAKAFAETYFSSSESYEYADYASGFRATFGDPYSSGSAFELTSAQVVSAVPEPGGWAMLLAGLAVVAGISRRANKRSSRNFNLRPIEPSNL
jgi:hypothetical protein